MVRLRVPAPGRVSEVPSARRRTTPLSKRALVLGGMWWWAVLRLLLEPEHAGLVEGAVAAGGWGLSLLPVHVTALARPRKAADEPRTGISAPPPTADRPGSPAGGPY